MTQTVCRKGDVLQFANMSPKLRPFPIIHKRHHRLNQFKHQTLCRRFHPIQKNSNSQTDLNKLSEWATKWQMNFNIAKCHLLRITQKRKPSHFTYTITNQPISQVESHPYLGITIDSNLSWSKHIHTTTSQCARTLGLLKRTLHPATHKVKETAYNIRPKLEYASVAWNSHKQNNIDTLEKIQRSAARFTLNDHRRKTSTTELINKLGWETLETQRIQHQLTFFYKIKQNLINIKLPQHIITPCSCTQNNNPNKYMQFHARIKTCIFILSKSH